MPEPIDIESLAGSLGRSVRTLLRWEKAGVNLANHDEVKAHAEKQDARTIGASRNRARARASGEKPQPRQSLSVRTADATGNIGAAGALQRLAETERTLYSRLQTALKSGNALAIADARTDWLQTSESLRRFDLAIEQSRRESGELVPKSEAERCARTAAIWFRLAWRLWLSSSLPDIVAIGDNLREAKHKCEVTFSEILEVSLKNAKESRDAMPRYASAVILDEWHVREQLSAVSTLPSDQTSL